jgi:hypothetical protein
MECQWPNEEAWECLSDGGSRPTSPCSRSAHPCCFPPLSQSAQHLQRVFFLFIQEKTNNYSKFKIPTPFDGIWTAKLPAIFCNFGVLLTHSASQPNAQNSRRFSILISLLLNSYVAPLAATPANDQLRHDPRYFYIHVVPSRLLL